MRKCILKDGNLGISYDLYFTKSEKKLEIDITLNYKSYDWKSCIDDKCKVIILKVNGDTLLDSPSSLSEMVLCRIDENILEYVKDNLKRVLSKVDIESSVDSYSLRYVIKAKVSCDDDKCIVAAGE